jgi:prophage regulatory protein
VDRVLKMPDVIAVTGLRRTSIYNLVNSGRFPKPIKLSERAIGWLATEITAWQQARAAARDTEAV